MIRLITGHAFIGSYTTRFRHDEPIHCPECGINPHKRYPTSFNHAGPRFSRARATRLSPVAGTAGQALPACRDVAHHRRCALPRARECAVRDVRDVRSADPHCDRGCPTRVAQPRPRLAGPRCVRVRGSQARWHIPKDICVV
ncbi:hypothetical protein BJV78DRAFT_1239493 [Lactifluus subvellereus]|nr:hypothetical protein BJV78DRAFT_1239493 [Lactifluus subvellereus]